MKFVKSISLFFFLPCLMLCMGVYLGVRFHACFEIPQNIQRVNLAVLEQTEEIAAEEPEDFLSYYMASADSEDILMGSTVYVIEEYDTLKGTTVQTEGKVPDKYLGMNREEFEAAMEAYALSPPLSERKRGFSGLEIQSFSKQRVVVRMYYRYVQPTDSFYLCVENNRLIVYCSDRKTVYMETEILLENLPKELQSEIILGMEVKEEETLYQLLETFSS